MVALACGVAGSAGGQVAFSGPASFATAVHDPFSPGEYYAAHVAAADFTGPGNQIDGFKDVAVYSGPILTGSFPEEAFSSVITLFRNTQNWAGLLPTNALELFSAPISVCDNCFVGEMQFADMNGDTFPDIIATSTSLEDVGSIHVWIYNSDLDIYLEKDVVTAPDLPPLQALGIGDFNGDGTNDVVASVHRLAFAQAGGDAGDLDRVIRLQNYDDGSGFGALLRITPDIAVTAKPGVTDKSPGDIVVGEFNTIQGFPGASVRPDFVTAEPEVDSMTLGSGFGSFGFTLADQSLPGPCGAGDLRPHVIAAGYIDAGSTLDLVGVQRFLPIVSVFLGNGRGRLTPACDGGNVALYQLDAGPACLQTLNCTRNALEHSVTLGKINADTYTDLLVANGCTDGERYVGIALGNGNGSFEVEPNACEQWLVHATTPSVDPLDRVLAVDMDNDGKDEVLVTASYENALVVFRNDTED